MHSFEHTAKERAQEEEHKRAMKDVMNALTHKSDCAVHNEPAFPNRDCDCGLLLSHRERHEIVMDCYDADPIDCAEGAVETACIEQLKRIKFKLQESLEL